MDIMREDALVIVDLALIAFRRGELPEDAPMLLILIDKHWPGIVPDELFSACIR